MRGKWSNNQQLNGHSTIPRSADLENIKFKHLQHSPSLRAIKVYNDLPVEGNFQNDIDLRLYTPQKYDTNSMSRISVGSSKGYSDQHFYEYINGGGTMSIASGSMDLNGSETNEMGSTAKLVPPKIEQSCQTMMYYISTTLCTMSMALGLGNLYRLPQTTMIRGGLPFLIAHLILTIFIGLPLLFLELGIGQLAQEGFIKSWRVVPFFRGIGYVKFLAGYMLSIYYPLYMGISLYFVIWIAKGSIPLSECSSGVKITEDGYSHYGKDGQKCLRSTFLKSAFEDPYWFGIFASILFAIWAITALLTISKTKSFIRSLVLLIFPTLACLIALFVKSVMYESELIYFYTKADWSLLESANAFTEATFVINIFFSKLYYKRLLRYGREPFLLGHPVQLPLSDCSFNLNPLQSHLYLSGVVKFQEVWYYAAIQVFFSSTVGFGSFVTNAGIIYNKVNPFWTAIGYCTINIIFGIGSTIISQSLARHTNVNITANKDDIAELMLVSVIYDIGSASTATDKKVWIIVIFSLFILSGFITMATMTYTLLKAITVGSRARLSWWQASILLSASGFIFGCAILLKEDFDIVHLLDHYIVGNLILITAILEVLTLLAFYGVDRIRSDFEFMLGHILSHFWLILWWIAPLVLTGLFAWGMVTLPLEGIYKDDPIWLYGVGWGVVLTASLLIFVTGFYVVKKQDGYTFIERFKTSFRPSKNWGPKDPISRHNWVQWNSKAQSGERDFTLKRKGTKDYTKSIKRTKKLAVAEAFKETEEKLEKQSTNTSNGTNIYSELNEPNNIHKKPHRNERPPYRVVSLSDANFVQFNGRKNPLARREVVSMPDEYGTFRKGPYVIEDEQVDHVCFRKISDHEDATEL